MTLWLKNQLLSYCYGHVFIVNVYVVFLSK